MPRVKAPAQPNLSLLNGLECLQQVVGATGAIGSREVARRTGLDPTRVNRLLGTLAYAGLLEQDSSRKYGPGPGLHVIAAQSMQASGLLAAALPVLHRLRRDDLTLALGVLWRNKVCYLFHERPTASIEDSILRHEPWPAQNSSAGIALLAAGPLPPEQIALEETPSQTRETFAEAIHEARQKGYARLTFPGGPISVGVTVGNPAIAAIAGSSAKLREDQIEDFAGELRAAAREIERELSSGKTR